MSNKILSLKINKPFGALEVQEVQFTEENGLIVVKAEVGSGKTTLSNALNVGLSGGSERSVSDIDLKKYPNDVDIEEAISYGDTPIFLHTKIESGQLSSTLFLKDKDGKKVTNPVVNGKKLTPALLRDLLRTSLTFNVSEFISENPRTQIDWMMATFKDKLREKGVVFDKKSTEYMGSILYQLEQAKMDRSRIYNKVAELNAFKTRLEQEGYLETNIPEYVSIEAIEADRKAATESYYGKLSEIDRKINDTKVRASEYNSVIRAYNESLDKEKQISDAALREEIRVFNESIKEMQELRIKIEYAVNLLIANGAPYGILTSWYEGLQPIPSERVFQPTKELQKVEQDEHGRYIQRDGLPETVNKAFLGIAALRSEVASLLAEKAAITSPDTDYTARIESAKASNRIAERWATFFEHQAADKKVRDLFMQYKKIFTEIDLGVEGLRMEIVGDEENGQDIRTTYNGAHDPMFFGNPKKEYRNLAAYSLTQKNVLSILMQVHLLSQKEEGLRFLFLECPFDTKTKNLIMDLQKKHDLQIIVTQTSDVDTENIKEGEIVISNGYLLSKKL